MKKSLALLALTAVITTGCASTQHTIRVSEKATMNSSINYDTVDYKETNHFFIGGLLQNSSTDAANVCPVGRKPAKVITETRWYQSLISMITIGLYTPRNTYIICS